MYSTVVVKWGKPVIQLPYRYLRILSLVCIALNILIVIYICQMFNKAVEIKLRLGDYIDLLLEKGYVLPSLLAMSGLLNLCLNVLVIFTMYKAFTTTKKYMATLFFGNIILTAIMIVIFLIFMSMAVSHGYNTNPVYIESLLDAMRNYSLDGLTKSKLDRLQVEFQCCGSRNYTDWYHIDWYDKNFIKKTETAVWGEAPYSCCSIRSNFPCVHHGIENGSGAYLYSNEANFSLSVSGCFNVIESKKKTTCWVVVGYIACLFLLQFIASIPLRFVQTAHIERKKFDKENHIYTAWLIGCYQGKEKKIEYPPPVPPLPPELMD